MKKFLIVLFSIFFTLTAEANFSTYESSIQKVDKDTITIQDSNNFKVGSSGIILHSFDDEHKTIIATVEVIKKENNHAILRYKSYKGLEQSALPSYKIKPTKDDKVILNYLYKRAMAIVPNRDLLQYVTKLYSDIDWIHPDIFASKLAISYTPVPQKSDFQNECKLDNFSMLLFAIEDKGYFVDCHTFKVIKEIDLKNSNDEIKVPFYSRIKKIKGRMFGLMGGEGIKDYNRYYKELLGL